MGLLLNVPEVLESDSKDFSERELCSESRRCISMGRHGMVKTSLVVDRRTPVDRVCVDRSVC